jgi:predicted metalloprotease with PDZ domain
MKSLEKSNSTPTNLAKINYDLVVINTTEHLLQVTMQVNLSAFQTSHCSSVTVALPAWIPGSYMIRDFSRNLHKLGCKQEFITLTQQSKQEWEVKHTLGKPLEKFELQYLIYANDLSVRSAFINDEYAFFNGTSVFLSVKTYENSIHEVRIDVKPGVLTSNNIATSLPLKAKETGKYIAKDYFELIDHPFLIGQYNDYCFTVLNHKFHLVFTGEHDFDFARMERDLRPIIEHHITLFGDFPCKEYWFITLVCEQGFGGLEHLASTVLQYSRFDLPRKGGDQKMTKEYQQFLSLCSHELFHTWHVKRIKPKVMHSPNLYEEVYTPQLWIYEGFTSFYDDLSLARSEIITPLDYVQILNEAITRLVRNPGRLKQSASESSFDAWNKFYKQDAGSVNHIVSYYNKGAIIALCLDITLRQQSNNTISLDTIMKHLWVQYGQTQIGTNDDVILALCKNEFDIDLSSFLHLATQTSIDLPLPTFLHSIGLQINMRANHHFQDKGGPSVGAAKYDIGGVLTMNDNYLKVASVHENRALSLAGLQVGDIIVAFNKWQCDDKRFLQLLNHCELEETVPIDVIRDGRLLSLNFAVKQAIADTCDIAIEDMQIFRAWLGLIDEPKT